MTVVPEPTAGPSPQYGAEAAMQESLAQVPMVGPDEVPNLSAPTGRPTEPVTTGLDIGMGEGSEVLAAGNTPDPVRTVLQAMLVAQPNNDVMRLLDLMDIQGR